MSDRSTGAAPSRLIAVLGPTNTGKTHLAVERMLGHGTGMIGLPLRLLAREIYDRIVKLRGTRSVALITGEEKIVPPHAQYFVCTVEAMPLAREVDFLAIDEIQLAADPERGHVFTHRLLHARGRHETMLLGSATMGPLIRRLLPEAEFQTRERFSRLTYAGPKKLTRLPPRSAVVAFSAENVYAIAELIRRQRGGAAVVMGSLSPRTRNAQVALYQSGEVDFLVATDAIGMGLNMDVDHVAFAGLRKFDGKRNRWLHAHELGQIAGRAGRFRTDGTFGVTGEAPDMDADLVQAIEEHRFEPVPAAEWRNARLDFGSLPGLLRSLAAPPPEEGLHLARESLDETTLRRLAEDEDIARGCRSKACLLRLWDVAQTPDFRKSPLDEHVRLVRSFYEHLTGRHERVPDDWMAAQHASLDHMTGDIDTLASRLASVRTLAYVAARPDWLRNPGEWQARTRALEDRLSDTLHERLMARFIDRRTSVLMRALNVREDVLAGVADDGEVTVEGVHVGRLRGIAFQPAAGGSALEDKALRHAAQRAVGPEIARRFGRLAADGDEAFALATDGVLLWRGDPAGKLAGGSPFAPKVTLAGDAISGTGGSPAARERAAQRLEAWLLAEAGRRLRALKQLREAVDGGKLSGIARGLAYRLLEGAGLLDRRSVETEVRSLSQAERRALRSLGVQFGAFTLHLPSLAAPDAHALLAAYAQLQTPGWRPPAEGITRAPAPPPSPETLAAHGFRSAGPWIVSVDALERLDELLRANEHLTGQRRLSDQAREELGWSSAQADDILRALSFAPTTRREPDQPPPLRRREPKPAPAPVLRPDSPFAVLAALRPAPAGAPLRRRRKRARPAPVA
ncbi:MAG: phosphonate-binding protein [Proteobacteria bacterium]|nr:phosphonate-binding protein [Pseudomonadota bacterium]